MVIGLQCPWLDDFIAKYPADTSGVLHWQGASVHSIWRIFCYLYQGDYSKDTAMALEGFGKLSISSNLHVIDWIKIDDEPNLLKHPKGLSRIPRGPSEHEVPFAYGKRKQVPGRSPY